MKVRLINKWFDQNGKRWKVGIHDMPDSYEEFLPKGAEVLDDKMNKVVRRIGDQPDPRPDPLNVDKVETVDGEKAVPAASQVETKEPSKEKEPEVTKTTEGDKTTTKTLKL